MGRFTFKRSEKLHYKRDFERVFEKGRRYRGNGFSVILKKQEIPSLRRLGIVVSRKLKSAVKRNRSKRLIREFFRLNKESFPPSADVIVIIYKPLSYYSEVEKRFNDLLITIRRNEL